ncbi:unnamed protein product [Lathyrus sativus]|nr:unnamed protein product [Lathyrus sativus]
MREMKEVNEEAFKHLWKIPPRQKISKYVDTILPNIIKKLGKESQKINSWIVRHAGEVDYKVRHISLIEEKFVVNLSKHECSYRRWMLIGLPCCHALAFMKDQHLQVDYFVPDYYKKECYEAFYAPKIYPVNGESLWTKTGDVDLQPLPIKRQPGRPKKKWNKDAGEQVRNDTQLKRSKFGIKCSRCHKDGHNKSTRKLPTTTIITTPNVAAITTPPPTTAAKTTPTLNVVATSAPPLTVVATTPSPPTTAATPPPPPTTAATSIRPPTAAATSAQPPTPVVIAPSLSPTPVTATSSQPTPH